jgi:phage baseplate assembly protein W
MRTDLLAFAQVIQNILIIEKGTYPNQPLLGVGIENYIFELFNDYTTNELKTEIITQINKFVTSDYDIDIDISKDTNTQNLTVLNLTFTISSNTSEEYSIFSIIFGGENKTKKTISKIIV